MKSDCLSFSAIPHSSRLFLDYLHDFSKVSQFYPRVPNPRQWLAEQAAELRYDDQRRERVAAVLERQNRGFGGSQKTLESIARLRSGAATVVTGQQVVLFGGPLFSILKAVSAVRVAAEASRSGVDAVPVFWLATEDHDLAEVNHTLIPDQDGQPRLLIAASRGVPGAPMSDIRLGAEIEPLVAEAAELLGETEVSQFLRESYRPDETFGTAFARLFARLFQDLGVILLDASDPELHVVAGPVMRAAVVGAQEIDEALLQRGAALRNHGYHEQVKVTPLSTLLFRKQNGTRVVIHRGNGGFTAGKEKFSEQELLQRITASPQDFSPNVLLRPVVQDYLLPTLAYVGGPAEVAYFAQAGVVYQEILGRMTPVLPRFSATLVDSRTQRLLAKYRLSLPDLFAGPEPTSELLATRNLPGDLQAQFDQAGASVTAAMNDIRASLERLDPTLVEAAGRAASKMSYQLRRLRSRTARAELRRSEEVGRHADALSAALYPNKGLQEREICGLYFVAREGRQLLPNLVASAQSGCPDHQIIYL